jgi:hypothetical protein
MRPHLVSPLGDLNFLGIIFVGLDLFFLGFLLNAGGIYLGTSDITTNLDDDIRFF